MKGHRAARKPVKSRLRLPGVEVGRSLIRLRRTVRIGADRGVCTGRSRSRLGKLWLLAAALIGVLAGSATRAEYALTLGAAEILGIADRVGSIEAGKQADLIVTTDTPLQTVSQVTHIFISGKPIELTSMHTENYEKFKNRPKPNLPPARELRGPKGLTSR